MPETIVTPHIWTDDQGRAWIDDVNVKVIEIALDHIAYGWTAESIQENHPSLTLAQVYAALAWYYDHQDDLDAEIERERERIEALRASAKPSPLAKRALLRRGLMSLGLYMDVHVPLPITRGLRRRGVDVLTAQDDNTQRLPDSQLLDRATGLGRLLFSEDSDLVADAVRRQREGVPFAIVIYARQLDVSIGRCIADLEALSKAALPEDAQGQIIFR